MCQGMDEGFFVIVLIAVGLVGGNFPSERVGIDFEFGKFFFDADLLEFGLGLDFITEGYGIVENAKSHSKDTARVFCFGKIEN